MLLVCLQHAHNDDGAAVGDTLLTMRLTLSLPLILALALTATQVEDTLFAIRQVASRPQILLLMLSNACSIAFFNYFGMSVTKTSSVRSRSLHARSHAAPPRLHPHSPAHGDTPRETRAHGGLLHGRRAHPLP